MPPSSEQLRNYAFFQEKLPELLSDPLKAEKFAVIFNVAVVGLYDTFDAAYRAACSKFSRDFIIQQIIDESKIVHFLSPVVAL